MQMAILIVGIPARIESGLLKELRKRFTDNHVFRTVSTKVFPKSQAIYEKALLDRIEVASVDIIFGNTNRPRGFCRNTGQDCSLNRGNKNTACRRDDHHTCSIDQPRHFIIIYQAGKNAGKLRDLFHYAPAFVEMGEQHYNRISSTYSFISSVIENIDTRILQTCREFQSKNTPLLLPPTNFRDTSLYRIFERKLIGDCDPKIIEEFRRTRFLKVKGKKQYINKSKIGFLPADNGIQHGIADRISDNILSITRFYRFGCKYNRQHHFDLSRADGRDFDGTISLFCRIKGDFKPKSTHVNLTVDDCVI